MKHIQNEKDILTMGKKPVGNTPFRFECHSGIKCFTNCCKNVNMDIYPYDIIRIKDHLSMHSEDFLNRFTYLCITDNPRFPTVKLRLAGEENKICPFLKEQGCSIYEDRPDACRMYPLERAVSITPLNPQLKREFYFLTPQPICQGHFQQKQWTVRQWLSDQKLGPFNMMNDFWAEIDVLLRSLQADSHDFFNDPKMKMAFMASYNIDSFRTFIFESTFLKRYTIKPHMAENLKTDDTELLKLGFDWIKFFLFQIRPLYFEQR
jgi:Fe-S-cluster containining protein